MDRRDYLRAKYLAAFLAGGVSVVLPMLMNFLTVACFIPMRMPEASEDMYYGVFGGSLWAEIFYTCPILYVLLYLVLDFVLLDYGQPFLFPLPILWKIRPRQFWAVLVSSVFFILLRLFCSFGICVDVTPINFIRATEITYPSNIWIILAELALLVVLDIFVLYRGEVKDVL